MEHIEDDSKIPEQAYDWFNKLPRANPQELAAFADWLKISPRHVGEFLMVTAVHRHYADIDPDRRIDIEALLTEETSNVVPLKSTGKVTDKVEDVSGRHTDKRRRRVWLSGIAAGVLALAFGGAYWLLSGGIATGWQSYETRTGEVRSLTLEDGSAVHLNTQSQIQVRFARQSREVRLLAGEALFEVKHDTARPFRVYSDTAAIQALGTQFDVYRHAQNTKVSVIEGRVQISTQGPGRQRTKLGAGEAADVSAGGHIIPLAAVAPINVTAWQEHQLIFRGGTLAEVVAEFNRYNRVPQFRIEDASAAERRISGEFDADEPEFFIRILIGLGGLVVERTEDEVIIRSRPNPSPPV